MPVGWSDAFPPRAGLVRRVTDALHVAMVCFSLKYINTTTNSLVFCYPCPEEELIFEPACFPMARMSSCAIAGCSVRL
jgi:hypothetical protein